tara:strand:+ start:5633 stop:6124 length:492 start_codon:yes stop_codon:yes gene_type:complete
MPVDTSKSIPSVKQYGLEPGAKTPQESALMKNTNAANEQNAINNQKAGYRKRKYRGGRGDQPPPGKIIVPQPTAIADPVGPVDANANTTQGTGTLTTSAANAEFDSKVGKGGGRRRKNTSQIGCSKRKGGKKRSYRKKRTTRKRKSLRKKRKVTRKKRTNKKR